MFDYVNVSIKCPKCGNIVRGFQTKDGECGMNTLEIEEVNQFYTTCYKCKSWIEFNRKNKIERLMNIEDLKRDFEMEMEELK
jgi:predicted nucleic-acid-binding Zn-ribbon protein